MTLIVHGASGRSFSPDSENGRGILTTYQLTEGEIERGLRQLDVDMDYLASNPIELFDLVVANSFLVCRVHRTSSSQWTDGRA